MQTRRERFALAAFLRARRGEIVVLLALAVFVVLTVFAKSPHLREEDAEATRSVQRLTTPALTALAEGLTALGSGVGLGVLAVPMVTVLVRKRKPVAAILLVASISGHLINMAIKAGINRPRPGVADDVLVILSANGSSFPSGHAQAAAMFWGFLAVIIGIHVRHKSLRYLGIGASLLMGLLICASRVYLGGHFVSDVVGGIAVGLVFLWGWVEAYRRFGAQEFAPPVPNSAAGSSVPNEGETMV